ncbi:hypothetical protein PBI_WHEATTHIN_69 [Gordonia phage WheatThin]|uniref:Uncharacterized protein n=1 Tax=Gordonia phage WheatThin TaxID=2499029 RepID=A0A3S9ULQ5_9CAUD|nr:hypothetical protein PBI_WHEATTHIN_69 [Gordonia phage WheatThin]
MAGRACCIGWCRNDQQTVVRGFAGLLATSKPVCGPFSANL